MSWKYKSSNILYISSNLITLCLFFGITNYIKTITSETLPFAGMEANFIMMSSAGWQADDCKKREIILTHWYIIRNIHRTDVCCIWTDNSIHNTALINASKITKRNLYVVHHIFYQLVIADADRFTGAL